MEEINRKETLNYKLFLLDEQYKRNTNYNAYVKESLDFYNGNQYPENNNKNMPRLSLNICAFSSSLKASKIVGTPIYITFTSDNDEVDCLKLERFDEYNCSKLKENIENYQSALNALNTGTELIYYYWDEEDTSYKGIYKGGLCLEHVYPTDYAVADPYIQDIQKQKWIMYWKDCELKSVRDMCEIESLKKKILPDDYNTNQETYHKDTDAMNHSLVRVYTRFFRVNGEVCFMSSTREVDLFKYPHAINPLLQKKILEKLQKEYEKDDDFDNQEEKYKDYEIDFEHTITQVSNVTKDELSKDEFKEIKEKFSLYPFAKFCPYVNNQSFYGNSDIKSLISVQKGLNFCLSMMLMCAQNNAYTKVFAKEGALQGQEITYEPGQIITDYSRYTNGWGIKLAESQPMPNGLMEFGERLLSMTRLVNGFNDVMDGSVSNQNLSGYAVQLMIKQANTTIEQQQQLFWSFCKDKANIRLMFYKFFVNKAKYTYQREDFEVKQEEQSRRALQQLENNRGSLEIGNISDALKKDVKKTITEEFNSKEIYGSNFDINIDVVQGLVDSKLAESQMWETLIINGGIQNLDPEMLELYMEANPIISRRTKQALNSIVKKQKLEENYRLKQQVQELIEKGTQLLQYAKELEAQSNYKTNYIDNLTKEFTNKINVANKTIQAQNAALSKSSNKVSEGEGKSLASRGIGGSDIVSTAGAQ